MLYLVMQNHQNTLPFLPGFPTHRRGRKRQSFHQKFVEQVRFQKRRTFKQLGGLFGRFIPNAFLENESSGSMSRHRIFSKENTFWAFLGQVLDADGGCKAAVRKIQAHASRQGQRIPSTSTASYCIARQKLDKGDLAGILQHTVSLGDKRPHHSILNNRRVVVVDGTGLSMPDTAQNQLKWPQSSNQKQGCGFPTARVCACFSLATGTLLSYEVGNKKNHELPLLRKQWSTFREDDIFLGDKGFCSYYDIAKFLDQGVDSIITLARRKPVKKSQCIKVNGKNDLVIEWKRPTYTPQLSYSKAEMEKLPKRLLLRQIRVVVEQPGFRKKEFYIITTLLDSKKYPSSEIASTYLQRWDVELFFRDIKTTMGMDILRCQSPEMICKEIMMHFIAYNCVRMMMWEAAQKGNVQVRKISFKGSLQAIRSWVPQINSESLGRAEKRKLIADLLEVIANLPLPDRQGRSEPRCVKRRPKAYQLLTKPRDIMREIPHRSKYTKKSLN